MGESVVRSLSVMISYFHLPGRLTETLDERDGTNYDVPVPGLYLPCTKSENHSLFCQSTGYSLSMWVTSFGKIAANYSTEYVRVVLSLNS